MSRACPSSATMASIVWSDTTSPGDHSRVESEFLLLLLLLDSAKESGSEDYHETNLFLGFEKAGLAEPVFCFMRLNDCIS
jgi:hypothetical protein